MKKIYLAFFLLLAFAATAQIKVTISSGQINIDYEVEDKQNIQIVEGAGVVLKDANLCDANTGKEQNIGAIYYIAYCDKKEIRFYPKKGNPEANFKSLFYCETGKKFMATEEDCETGAIPASKYGDLTQVPFPNFQDNNNDQFDNVATNRYLFIDAHPDHTKKVNNILYRPKKISGFGAGTFSESFKKAAGLPVNGSLTVFIRNYHFHDLEKVTVSLNGEDYNYTMDINDIFERSKKTEEGAGGTPTTPTVSGGEDKTAKELRIETGLNAVLTQLTTKYKYLNINDLYLLEKYKAALKAVYDENPEALTPAAKTVLDQILVWYPEYTSLTPISGIVPENDEVEVELSIKNTGKEALTQTIGRYRTSGGITFGLGSMLYITNLKNNDVYITTSQDTPAKKTAHLNSNNQLSLGIGLNGEVFFRTGGLLRPTLNVGFFVPFDEDLTPIVGMGPGISIAAKNIKLSFSYGIAIGKVNVIKEQYKGVDLTTLGEDITTTNLTEKVWKIGNYFGVGLRFNIFDSPRQNP